MKRLERYATPKDIADALLSVQERISAGELRSVLPKNATPEQVAQWRRRTASRKHAEKYELKLKTGSSSGRGQADHRRPAEGRCTA
jgi:hypothetical protein